MNTKKNKISRGLETKIYYITVHFLHDKSLFLNYIYYIICNMCGFSVCAKKMFYNHELYCIGLETVLGNFSKKMLKLILRMSLSNICLSQQGLAALFIERFEICASPCRCFDSFKRIQSPETLPIPTN